MGSLLSPSHVAVQKFFVCADFHTVKLNYFSAFIKTSSSLSMVIVHRQHNIYLLMKISVIWVGFSKK